MPGKILLYLYFICVQHKGIKMTHTAFINLSLFQLSGKGEREREKESGERKSKGMLQCRHFVLKKK